MLGKVTVAVAPAARLPVQLNVLNALASTLYEIVVAVKVVVPKFFNVTEGVTVASVVVPFGVAIAEIPASLDTATVILTTVDVPMAFKLS